MKTGDVIKFLDQSFKPEYQEDYDNAGFLVGDRESEYTGALVTLDVTPDTVDEAIGKGLSLIVSHHPLIFSGIKRITSDSATGRMITKLIQHGTSVYAAHTNLDNMDWGVNGILADKIGLNDRYILRPMEPESSQSSGCESQMNIGAGLTGHLPHPISVMEFLVMVKERLGLPVIRTSQLIKKDINKVAICGGSGSFLINDAKKVHADIYLTGDLKYHDFQQAENKIILADIGHYESEQFSKELICRIISEKFSNFACLISTQSESYIKYI